jgi:hypothetical protein
MLPTTTSFVVKLEMGLGTSSLPPAEPLEYLENLHVNWEYLLLRQPEYLYLQSSSFLHCRPVVHFKIKQGFDLPPIYPTRSVYANGHSAHFPLKEWETICRLRATQSGERLHLFCRDVAYSTEGIRLMLRLRYPVEPALSQWKDFKMHVLGVQTVVKDYFRNASVLDTGFWLLTNLNTEAGVRSKVGIDLVFPRIVIDCHQGKQIISSVRYWLEENHGLVGVVKCPYKTHVLSQRPVFAYKQGQCTQCETVDPVNRCRGCYGTRTRWGDMYLPHTYFDNDFQVTCSAAEGTLPGMVCLLTETSAVNVDQLNFTSGYSVPASEPAYLQDAVVSSHAEDKDRDYVYKQDRSVLNQNLKKFTLYAGPGAELRDVLSAIVRKFSPVYRYLRVTRVYTWKSAVLVEVNGANRSYCNLIKGYHAKNRIYFTVNQSAGVLTQCCFNKECRHHLLKREVQQAHSLLLGKFQLKKLKTVLSGRSESSNASVRLKRFMGPGSNSADRSNQRGAITTPPLLLGNHLSQPGEGHLETRGGTVPAFKCENGQ